MQEPGVGGDSEQTAVHTERHTHSISVIAEDDIAMDIRLIVQP